MVVTGVHTLVYTEEAEAVRAIFRDVFGWEHVDTGEGWLIFALPPAELGVHPGTAPGYEISLMCDDLSATMRELEAKGIEFVSPPEDRVYGMVTTMLLPGGVEMQLYEPSHPQAI